MRTLRNIELDAASWETLLDFYDALLKVLGAPAWHGKNVNALIDSMIYGDINAIEPPYVIRVRNIDRAPRDVIDHVTLIERSLSKARADFRAERGWDKYARFEVAR